MLLIPAMELKGGHCVKRKPGKPNEVVTHAESPTAMAQRLMKSGARRLHVNDLDSLVSGRPAHASAVKEIVAACPGIVVQVGGGMRSEETVLQYIEAGAEFVVLGTRTATAPHFINDLCLEYPGHIIVSLDAKGGRVAAEGWSKLAHTAVAEVAEHFQREGVAAIVYTTVGEAMGDATEMQAVAELARAVAIPVIAAGPYAQLDEVRALCKAAGEELLGALVGDGLDFAQARKLLESPAGKA